MTEHLLYKQLAEICRRPAPYSVYTAPELWTDPHISQQMLRAHLDQSNDRASYRIAFIEAAVSWMEQQFGVGEGTRIADFGCGPGLYATRLAALDADVTAIDFSLRSLRYAEETADAQGLSITFVHDNYLSFASHKRFDLILLISCDFGALSPVQRAQLLQIFVAHLAENGAILLDVFSMTAFAEREEGARWGHRLGNGFWASEDYYGFVNSFRYEAERVALDKYTIVTAERDFTIYTWDQFYDRETLAQEFVENGLAIEEWYANVAGAAYDQRGQTIAVVARKAGPLLR